MPAPIPVGSLTIASVGLTAIVVGNAYYQKKQFYPSVVYITKSNTSMAAIYFLSFILVILFGKLLKKVFFGQLRTAEFEQLIERSFYAITETCLAFTVFRDDFSPKFVALFTVLLFLKAFHHLTDSRVDFMERSPVITTIFHLRVASLLLLLIVFDLLLLNHSYQSTIAQGATVQLVFGFEYAILLTVVLNIGVKYLCHSIDLRLENPWENKSAYLLYTELIIGFVKVVLYAVFLLIMMRIHTFPLFILRPMYITLRSFKNALNGVVQWRRAVHNMNTLYPEVTPEELSSVDNVCIICREEMASGAKKLPCGHIFHSSCLRSWFQRQQTCPTCRMNILREAAAPASVPPQQPPPQQPQPQQQPQNQQQNQINGNPFAVLFGNPAAAPQGVQGAIRPPFPFAPFQLNQLQQQFQQQQAAAAAQRAAAAAPTTTAQQAPTTTSQSQATNSTGVSSPHNRDATNTSSQSPHPATGVPFMPLPFTPFSLPFPIPPPNYEGLTLEELRKMEGRERIHVEARIKSLKNIQTLLDAAAFQLNQYNAVMSTLDCQTAFLRQSVDAMAGPSAPHPAPSENDASKSETAAVPSTPQASTEESSDMGAGAAAPCVPNGSDPECPMEIRRRRLEKIYGKENADSRASPSSDADHRAPNDRNNPDRTKDNRPNLELS